MIPYSYKGTNNFEWFRGLKMPRSSPQDQRLKVTRARITNGKELLTGIDGRSIHARIFRHTYHSMLSHCGGADHVSEPLRLMCRRAAALETELVNLESRFAQLRNAGEEPNVYDIDLHSRLTNTLRRVCETLGWQRNQRDITPNLEQYLAGKQPSTDVEDLEEVEEVEP